MLVGCLAPVMELFCFPWTVSVFFVLFFFHDHVLFHMCGYLFWPPCPPASSFFFFRSLVQKLLESPFTVERFQKILFVFVRVNRWNWVFTHVCHHLWCATALSSERQQQHSGALLCFRLLTGWRPAHFKRCNWWPPLEVEGQPAAFLCLCSGSLKRWGRRTTTT